MTERAHYCQACHGSTLRPMGGGPSEPSVAICADCGTVYNRASRDVSSDVVSVPAEAAIREFSAYNLGAYQNGSCDRILRAHVPPRGRALDIGCFDGAFVAFLKSRGFDAFGLEMQEDMVAFCRRQGLAVSAGMFPHALPEEMLRGRFDLITSLESAYYWDDLESCAESLNTLLNADGHVMIKLVQGTSDYFSEVRRYDERTRDFRSLLNIRALRALLSRYGFDFVAATPHAYIHDRRRYHPNPILRCWYRNWNRLRSLWAAKMWPPEKWDKIVVLFRKRA
ncbi:MAG TPA: methyltransferase domain-containing protein [Phycisphaerae bacterium]|nr:methyltransferase domain-containing protein [Phycisphaerae bacterium]HRW55690.1 methyltransferase domain-containing protein [Phycisphaerae bacterium]